MLCSVTANIFSAHQFDLTISVGASPQVTSIQNFAATTGLDTGATESLSRAIRGVSAREATGIKISLELHAGVYSVLDLQQLATNSRYRTGGFEGEIA